MCFKCVCTKDYDYHTICIQDVWKRLESIEKILTGVVSIQADQLKRESRRLNK